MAPLIPRLSPVEVLMRINYYLSTTNMVGLSTSRCITMWSPIEVGHQPTTDLADFNRVSEYIWMYMGPCIHLSGYQVSVTVYSNTDL